LDTVARYTHVATNVLRTVTSPPERLTLPKEGPPEDGPPEWRCSSETRPGLEVADVFRDHVAHGVMPTGTPSRRQRSMARITLNWSRLPWPPKHRL
jgi:hypothetical protein